MEELQKVEGSATVATVASRDKCLASEDFQVNKIPIQLEEETVGKETRLQKEQKIETVDKTYGITERNETNAKQVMIDMTFGTVGTDVKPAKATELPTEEKNIKESVGEKIYGDSTVTLFDDLNLQEQKTGSEQEGTEVKKEKEDGSNNTVTDAESRLQRDSTEINLKVDKGNGTLKEEEFLDLDVGTIMNQQASTKENVLSTEYEKGISGSQKDETEAKDIDKHADSESRKRVLEAINNSTLSFDQGAPSVKLDLSGESLEVHAESVEVASRKEPEVSLNIVEMEMNTKIVSPSKAIATEKKEEEKTPGNSAAVMSTSVITASKNIQHDKEQLQNQEGTNDKLASPYTMAANETSSQKVGPEGSKKLKASSNLASEEKNKEPSDSIEKTKDNNPIKDEIQNENFEVPCLMKTTDDTSQQKQYKAEKFEEVPNMGSDSNWEESSYEVEHRNKIIETVSRAKNTTCETGDDDKKDERKLNACSSATNEGTLQEESEVLELTEASNEEVKNERGSPIVIAGNNTNNESTEKEILKDEEMLQQSFLHKDESKEEAFRKPSDEMDEEIEPAPPCAEFEKDTCSESSTEFLKGSLKQGKQEGITNKSDDNKENEIPEEILKQIDPTEKNDSMEEEIPDKSSTEPSITQSLAEETVQEDEKKEDFNFELEGIHRSNGTSPEMEIHTKEASEISKSMESTFLEQEKTRDQTSTLVLAAQTSDMEVEKLENDCQLDSEEHQDSTGDKENKGMKDRKEILAADVHKVQAECTDFKEMLVGEDDHVKDCNTMSTEESHQENEKEQNSFKEAEAELNVQNLNHKTDDATEAANIEIVNKKGSERLDRMEEGQDAEKEISEEDGEIKNQHMISEGEMVKESSKEDEKEVIVPEQEGYKRLETAGACEDSENQIMKEKVTAFTYISSAPTGEQTVTDSQKQSEITEKLEEKVKESDSASTDQKSKTISAIREQNLEYKEDQNQNLNATALKESSKEEIPPIEASENLMNTSPLLTESPKRNICEIEKAETTLNKLGTASFEVSTEEISFKEAEPEGKKMVDSFDSLTRIETSGTSLQGVNNGDVKHTIFSNVGGNAEEIEPTEILHADETKKEFEDEMEVEGCDTAPKREDQKNDTSTVTETTTSNYSSDDKSEKNLPSIETLALITLSNKTKDETWKKSEMQNETKVSQITEEKSMQKEEHRKLEEVFEIGSEDGGKKCVNEEPQKDTDEKQYKPPPLSPKVHAFNSDSKDPNAVSEEKTTELAEPTQPSNASESETLKIEAMLDPGTDKDMLEGEKMFGKISDGLEMNDAFTDNEKKVTGQEGHHVENLENRLKDCQEAETAGIAIEAGCHGHNILEASTTATEGTLSEKVTDSDQLSTKQGFKETDSNLEIETTNFEDVAHADKNPELSHVTEVSEEQRSQGRSTEKLADVSNLVPQVSRGNIKEEILQEAENSNNKHVSTFCGTSILEDESRNLKLLEAINTCSEETHPNTTATATNVQDEEDECKSDDETSGLLSQPTIEAEVKDKERLTIDKLHDGEAETAIGNTFMADKSERKLQKSSSTLVSKAEEPGMKATDVHINYEILNEDIQKDKNLKIDGITSAGLQGREVENKKHDENSRLVSQLLAVEGEIKEREGLATEKLDDNQVEEVIKTSSTTSKSEDAGVEARTEAKTTTDQVTKAGKSNCQESSLAPETLGLGIKATNEIIKHEIPMKAQKEKNLKTVATTGASLGGEESENQGENYGLVSPLPKFKGEIQVKEILKTEILDDSEVEEVTRTSKRISDYKDECVEALTEAETTIDQTVTTTVKSRQKLQEISSTLISEAQELGREATNENIKHEVAKECEPQQSIERAVTTATTLQGELESRKHEEISSLGSQHHRDEDEIEEKETLKKEKLKDGDIEEIKRTSDTIFDSKDGGVEAITEAETITNQIILTDKLEQRLQESLLASDSEKLGTEDKNDQTEEEKKFDTVARTASILQDGEVEKGKHDETSLLVPQFPNTKDEIGDTDSLKVGELNNNEIKDEAAKATTEAETTKISEYLLQQPSSTLVSKAQELVTKVTNENAIYEILKEDEIQKEKSEVPPAIETTEQTCLPKEESKELKASERGFEYARKESPIDQPTNEEEKASKIDSKIHVFEEENNNSTLKKEKITELTMLHQSSTDEAKETTKDENILELHLQKHESKEEKLEELFIGIGEVLQNDDAERDTKKVVIERDDRLKEPEEISEKDGTADKMNIVHGSTKMEKPKEQNLEVNTNAKMGATELENSSKNVDYVPFTHSSVERSSLQFSETFEDASPIESKELERNLESQYKIQGHMMFTKTEATKLEEDGGIFNKQDILSKGDQRSGQSFHEDEKKQKHPKEKGTELEFAEDNDDKSTEENKTTKNETFNKEMNKGNEVTNADHISPIDEEAVKESHKKCNEDRNNIEEAASDSHLEGQSYKLEAQDNLHLEGQSHKLRDQEHQGEFTNEANTTMKKGMMYDEVTGANTEKYITDKEEDAKEPFLVSLGNEIIKVNHQEDISAGKQVKEMATKYGSEDQSCKTTETETIDEEVQNSDVVWVNQNLQLTGQPETIEIRKDEVDKDGNLSAATAATNTSAEVTPQRQAASEPREVSELVPEEPVYGTIIANEELMKNTTEEKGGTKTQTEVDKLTKTCTEVAYKPSDIADSLNLKNEEVPITNPSTSSITEVLQEEIPRQKGEITDNKTQGFESDKQTTDVNRPAGEGQAQHSKDKAPAEVILTKECKVKLDEAKIHETLATNDSRDSQAPRQEESAIHLSREPEAADRSIKDDPKEFDNTSNLVLIKEGRVSINLVSQGQSHESEETEVTNQEEFNDPNEYIYVLSHSHPSEKDKLQNEVTLKHTDASCDTKKVEKTSAATSEEQIPEEAEPIQSKEARILMGKDDILSVPLYPVTNIFQFDQNLGRASDSELEAKEVKCGEGKTDSIAGETDESKPMESDKVSPTHLLPRSTKESFQKDGHFMEDRKPTTNEAELKSEETEGIHAEEAKVDNEQKDKEEEKGERKEVDLGIKSLDMVEASRDVVAKPMHKKSHNILSGVGSKVKHSIAQVTKAITGKCTHPQTPSPK